MPRGWLVLAWLPVSLVLAFAAGEALISMSGYPVGGASPAWVSSLSDIVACAIAVLPAAVAAPLSWHDYRRGDRRSFPPFVVACAVAAVIVGFSLLSMIGDLLR